MVQVWENIINQAIKAGIAARLDGVRESQVSKILEILWDSPADRAIETTILYILRQRARRVRDFPLIGHLTAKLVVNGLREIKKIAGDDVEKAKALATEFLGLFKWVYEASEHVRVKRDLIPQLDLEKYLQLLRI